MDKSEIKRRIKEDFDFLSSKALAVLLYGSLARGEENGRSDIDVCIVAPKVRDKIRFLRETMAIIGGKYDIRIFELMPIYLKIGVIENHEIIYGDACELNEYFYFFRKIWRDQAHRQKLTKEEVIHLFE